MATCVTAYPTTPAPAGSVKRTAVETRDDPTQPADTAASDDVAGAKRSNVKRSEERNWFVPRVAVREGVEEREAVRVPVRVAVPEAVEDSDGDSADAVAVTEPVGVWVAVLVDEKERDGGRVAVIDFDAVVVAVSVRVAVRDSVRERE